MDEEPQSITVEIELDPVHQRAAYTLSENNINIEKIALAASQPAVEKALYAALQEAKYNED